MIAKKNGDCFLTTFNYVSDVLFIPYQVYYIKTLICMNSSVSVEARTLSYSERKT